MAIIRWVFTPKINLVDLIGILAISQLAETNANFYWLGIPLFLFSGFMERALRIS